MAAPTIFVIDGHRDSRESICHFLRANGHRAKPFGTASAFEHALSDEQPGCVVLDVGLPDGCGFALQQRLKEREIAPPVIMTSDHATPRLAVAAMKQGAIDFLEKPLCPETLLKEVRLALDRDAENRVRQAQIAVARRRLGTLTAREREVFDAITASLGTKQIAARLGISPRTIEVHRSRVLTKMGVETVIELARVAHLLGLFPVSARVEQPQVSRMIEPTMPT
ncbi:MAG TPA: response regulator [Pirellulales bacterium]|nr:response regulator [Pirellulales bacterium]